MKHFLAVLLFFLVATPAALPAQSKSAGAAPVTLTGQIVCCADCWAEADRRTVAYGTASDLAKAADCIAKRDPTLLAVMNSEGETAFYQLEEGKYQRSGENWLGYVGKRVAVTGTTRRRKDTSYVKVDSLNVLVTPAMQGASVVGTEAELALKDLFGVEQKLSALRGRIVVLNFWATYCAPCRTEMPDLAAIQNEYAALGVQVVGASAEPLSDQPKVLQFIRETKINFPVWLGASVADMGKFGLGPELPGTAIINRDGRIATTTRGIVNQATLKKQLDALIAEAQTKAKKEIAAAKEKSSEASSVPS